MNKVPGGEDAAAETADSPKKTVASAMITDRDRKLATPRQATDKRLRARRCRDDIDVFRAAAILEDGRAADGTRVLAPGTPARMHDREVDLPELGFMGTSWGLGFERFDNPAGTIIGHDGTTIGQGAFLRMMPEAGLAVALMTNGGNIVSLYRDVVGHILGELTDVDLPALPVPPAQPRRIDAGRYVGTYSTQVFDLTVSQDNDQRIWIEQTPKGIFEEMGGQVERTEFVHYRDDVLIPLDADRGMQLRRNAGQPVAG
ncbi:serine hydrolase [Kibdelosporangium aridum]|nr:serine hydrolase [Kibdelosporangium aridum]